MLIISSIRNNLTRTYLSTKASLVLIVHNELPLIPKNRITLWALNIILSSSFRFNKEQASKGNNVPNALHQHRCLKQFLIPYIDLSLQMILFIFKSRYYAAELARVRELIKVWDIGWNGPDWKWSVRSLVHQLLPYVVIAPGEVKKAEKNYWKNHLSMLRRQFQLNTDGILN